MGVARLGQIKALDGLRGIAVMLVIAYHYSNVPIGGAYGVDLFFVLSGFLITTLLLEEHERFGRISLRAFYIRRARRLLPALGLILAVVAILGAFVFPFGLLVEVIAGPAFYVQNFLFAFGDQSVHRHWHWPTVHLWSLAQEEQFYLLWPPLLIVLLRYLSVRRLVVFALVVFVAICVYRDVLAAGGASWWRLYFGPDVRFDGLMVGCTAAFARASGFVVARWVGWAGLVFFLFVSATMGPGAVMAQVTFLPIVELGCGALILVAIRPGVLARVLSVAPLPWLGGISYSLYLWHYVMLWAFDSRMRLVPLVLTIVIAYASTRWFEEPIRRRRSAPMLSPVPAFAD